MDGHCCEEMRRQVTRVCEQHPVRFDCPDCLVHYRENCHEYGLIVHDGGSSFILIHYCPWCGACLSDEGSGNR